MNAWILAAAGILLAAAAGWAVFHRAPRALLALTFEKTGRAPENSRLKKEWTSLTRLERTLKTLCARGFTAVFPEDLNRKKLPAKPVLLAFMGGYQSFYTDVFPLLQKYHLKACVFLAQEYVGTYDQWKNPYWEPWQNLLTEKQIKELSKSGLVSFGALDLKAREVTLLPADEARFGAEENIFRLPKQLGVTAQAFAFWPAKKWNKKTARDILRGLENLPVLTPVFGVNPIEKNTLLNTLPAGSLRARLAVWFRR